MAQDKSTLTFTTESLPTFFVGVPANFTVQAVGGKPPYTFRVTKGSLAPMKLSTDGVIRGTATAPSNSTVIITVSDSARPAASVNQAFDVEVQAQAKRAKI